MSSAAVISAPPPSNPMPKAEQPWTKYILIAGLVTGGAGGVPYITTLQSRIDETRERSIRMEEQIKALIKTTESIEKTQESIRSRLESKGIVNHLGFDQTTTPSLSGEKYIEGK